MKLLLHICCAPCSIHPYKWLKLNKADSVTGFFYNPNIHPYTEYNMRKKTLEDYSRKVGLKCVFGSYHLESFFREISGNEKFGDRCRICWRMRLEETANYAKSNGFNSFTTTLLASPYQDHCEIERIGRDISRRTGVDFLYKDFRSGFRASHDEAKEMALYRQKYCGCIFSERERYEGRATSQRTMNHEP